MTVTLKRFLIRWLEQVWYGNRPVERILLRPLSLLFCYLAKRRRQSQTAAQKSFSVPLIIIGNIAVGGTGKTPLTIYLAQLLQREGYRPGIVSRGYGSHPDKTMIRPVTYHNKPADVGDEALLMATRTHLPVVVGIQRIRAVAYLLENYDVDIVLSDDGLQHYRIARDLEIVVIDGQRRNGNGLCLPAGPLREQPQRLQECDFVVVNGKAQAGEYAMRVCGERLVAVAGSGRSVGLAEFAGLQVHVVTAIGNPQRFISALQAADIHCITHIYPDHYLFQGDEFTFDDGLPVLITEKDAVKCRQFDAQKVGSCWYLPVDAQLGSDFGQSFLAKVKQLSQA
ncbi:MAG: tetraacyldisaccharide 4'-kinase [Thiolinea sp.]